MQTPTPPPAIPPYIQKLTKADEAKNVMENAKKKGNEPVYWAAFQRLCELGGMNYDDPMERDFYAVLAAYEHLLSEKNDRKTRASYTRRKLEKSGVEQCLIDWANDDKETAGFKLLMDNGKAHLTAEYVVLRYASRLPADAVENARKRLEKHGVTYSESSAA